MLKLLSLDSAAFAEGSAVTKWIIWNGKGRRLGEGVLAGPGAKSIFIKRVPLGAILSGEVERQGIKIERGKKLQNIELRNTDNVVATFQDGSTARGDLLIGCNGVHSQTRQFVDPAVRPVYRGLINTGGYTQGVKVLSTPETTNFKFGKRAFFGYHVSPSGYIYWFVNIVQAEEPTREALQAGSDAERRQWLVDLFRDDQPFINHIIQAAETIFPEFLSYTPARAASKVAQGTRRAGGRCRPCHLAQFWQWSINGIGGYGCPRQVPARHPGIGAGIHSI